jgi:hypothetical protein
MTTESKSQSIDTGNGKKGKKGEKKEHRFQLQYGWECVSLNPPKSTISKTGALTTT